MLKVKVTKSDNVYFDGEYVTNGHWMLPASQIELSMKVLNGLMKAGVKFSYKEYTGVEAGKNANIPDMKKVLPGDFETRDNPARMLKLVFNSWDGSFGFRPFIVDDECCLVNEIYSYITAHCTVHPDPSDMLKCAVLAFPSEDRGILMPAIDKGNTFRDLREDLEVLLESMKEGSKE